MMHTPSHHRKFLKCALGAKRINIRFFPLWQGSSRESAHGQGPSIENPFLAGPSIVL